MFASLSVRLRSAPWDENGIDFHRSFSRPQLHPVMWIGNGGFIPHDEQHAFRYEVRDQRGTTIVSSTPTVVGVTQV
jgi:hypothetical protein